MDNWARRRKLIYASLAILILASAIGIPSFVFFYKAPTCFDGKQNGGEKGIDCGGKCQLLCQSDFFPPTVSWTRIDKVVNGVYNVSAYIINPNNEGEAKDVPYEVTLFDNLGIKIVSKKGSVTIPPHRNTLAFAGLINTDKYTPVKALFEFTSAPNWVKKSDQLVDLVIKDMDYSEINNSSSLIVNLENTGLKNLNNISVYSVLYDASGNTIGFGKTVVDEIKAKSNAIAPFTWNINRNGKVVSKEVLYVAE
jgi:hypothetical protein